MLRTVSLIALPMLLSASLGHAQAQRRLDASIYRRRISSSSTTGNARFFADAQNAIYARFAIADTASSRGERKGHQ